MKTDDPLNPSSDTAKTSSSCAASTKAANGKVDPTSACGPIAAAVTGGPEGALGSDAAVAASLGAAGAADAGADEGFQLGALDGEFAVALDEMDVADQEDAEIHGGDDDMTELLDTWGGNQEDHHDERPDDGEIDLDDPHPAHVGALAKMYEDAAGGADVPSGGADAGVEDGPLAEDVAEPPQPWEQLGEPSASGFVAYKNRTIMRIQRGRPAKSVTVTCYRHTGCSLCITETRCPADQELFKWLFEGDPNNDGDSKDQRREKARIHMDSAKSRWYAKKPAAK
eukprot:9474729-Pyramimonas_sp.AAC.1